MGLLQKYAAASIVLAGAVIVHAVSLRLFFYPSLLYLLSNKLSAIIIGNLVCCLGYLSWRLLTTLFFQKIRSIEVETLYDNSRYAITETCFALAIFTEEVNLRVAASFVAILFCKAFHWLAEARVDSMEQMETVPLLTYARLLALLILLFVVDLRSAIQVTEKILVSGPSVLLLIAFDVTTMTITCTAILIRLFLNAVEQLVVGGVGEWADKPGLVFTVEVVTELARISLYVVFVFYVYKDYGAQGLLYIMHDFWRSLSSLHAKVMQFMRWREVMYKLDQRFPDTTAAELAASSDKTCIICREQMGSSDDDESIGGEGSGCGGRGDRGGCGGCGGNEHIGAGGPGGAENDDSAGADAAAAAAAADRPAIAIGGRRLKTLQCGHIFHLDCLQKWLREQSSCPTCRSEIQGLSAPPTRAAAGAGAGAGAGPMQMQEGQGQEEALVEAVPNVAAEEEAVPNVPQDDEGQAEEQLEIRENSDATAAATGAGAERASGGLEATEKAAALEETAAGGKAAEKAAAVAGKSEAAKQAETTEIVTEQKATAAVEKPAEKPAEEPPAAEKTPTATAKAAAASETAAAAAAAVAAAVAAKAAALETAASATSGESAGKEIATTLAETEDKRGSGRLTSHDNGVANSGNRSGSLRALSPALRPLWSPGRPPLSPPSRSAIAKAETARVERAETPQGRTEGASGTAKPEGEDMGGASGSGSGRSSSGGSSGMCSARGIRRSLRPPWLPVEWTVHTSSTTGLCYCFNSATGEKYWMDEKLPKGWVFDKSRKQRQYVNILSGSKTHSFEIVRKLTDADKEKELKEPNADRPPPLSVREVLSQWQSRLEAHQILQTHYTQQITLAMGAMGAPSPPPLRSPFSSPFAATGLPPPSPFVPSPMSTPMPSSPALQAQLTTLQNTIDHLRQEVENRMQ